MQIYEKKTHKRSQNNNKRSIYLRSRDLRMCIENINFFIFHQLNFEFRRDQINFLSESLEKRIK